jgi:alkylation response protein AidB-like acyl-CoA dehydrogenase
MLELTDLQKDAQTDFNNFVNAEIVPSADHYDQIECLPSDLIQKVAKQRYLGAVLPQEYGGGGMEMITYGLLNEEIGRGCSSLRSLLTVHGMVAWAILRWGSKEQRERWLQLLSSGELIAAFALTEQEAGSDARNITSTAAAAGDYYVLNGRKKWITFGQIADLFLVFAKCGEKSSAFLVERNTPGLTIKPIKGMLGVRASMLAELEMEECRIPKSNRLGREGLGLSHIASAALDLGRYTVAWGCVGIGRACLEASVKYVNERRQFGAYLKDHQLIQKMITDMIVNVKAAKLLCLRAAHLKNTGDPQSVVETSIAKYFASVMATKTANDAVQIHGANGCSSEYSVQRYLRDAKIMEIIEGSTQIQQITIAQLGYQEFV